MINQPLVDSLMEDHRTLIRHRPDLPEPARQALSRIGKSLTKESLIAINNINAEFKEAAARLAIALENGSSDIDLTSSDLQGMCHMCRAPTYGKIVDGRLECRKCTYKKWAAQCKHPSGKVVDEVHGGFVCPDCRYTKWERARKHPNGGKVAPGMGGAKQ